MDTLSTNENNTPRTTPSRFDYRPLLGCVAVVGLTVGVLAFWYCAYRGALKVSVLSKDSSDVEALATSISYEKTGDFEDLKPLKTGASFSVGKILLNRHARPSRRLSFRHRRNSLARPSPLRQNATDSITQVISPLPTAHCSPSALSTREIYTWMTRDKMLHEYDAYNYVNSELRRNHHLRLEEMDTVDGISSPSPSRPYEFAPPGLLSPRASRSSHRKGYDITLGGGNPSDVPYAFSRIPEPSQPQPTSKSNVKPRKRRPLQVVGGNRCSWDGVVGYKKDWDQAASKESRKVKIGHAARSAPPKSQKENQAPSFQSRNPFDPLKRNPFGTQSYGRF